MLKEEGGSGTNICQWGLQVHHPLLQILTATHLHDLIADGTMELFIDSEAYTADTFDEMLKKLTQVFKPYREWKLSLLSSKCWLFMTEITFAGATIGPQGIQPDLEKLMAIVN